MTTEETTHQHVEQSLVALLMQWCDVVMWAGLQPVLQRMLDADLSLAECLMLKSLRRGSFTIAEAAACLHVSQHSTASRAVDRMVREGYVDRHEDPADRRQKRLTLTAKGETLIEEFEGLPTEAVRSSLESLSTEEQQQFGMLLGRLIAAAGTDDRNCRWQPGRLPAPA